MTAEGRHWSLEVSLGAMGKLKIDKAILSLPPGYPPDQKDVRAANQELKSMRDRYPTKFGFWAALGDLRNTEGTLVLFKIYGINATPGLIPCAMRPQR
jgi:hypothetical protein